MSTSLVHAFRAAVLFTMTLAVCSLSEAQPTSDLFSSSGEYDRFAVGGAHRWFDNHTADFKERGSHCLSILDQAKIDQDEALALYEQARQPGVGNATELVRQANQKIQMRGEKLRAFTDCVNQANRRPMLQGRIEQNEPSSDQQPDDDSKTPPTSPKPGPPAANKIPPPRHPVPDRPDDVPVPRPLPSPSPTQPLPGGTSSSGPGRYKFGTPDPPFMFADGVSKGMGDCFAENLPSDLATAPLAVIKRLERLRKAVEIIGKAGSIYAIYEDIKTYDPTADPYETGKWLGKLICDGKDLREAVKHKQNAGAEKQGPTGSQPNQTVEHTSAPAQKQPPSTDAGGFIPKTHFPPAPDPLKRGMPLEDHKQLRKLAVDEHKIIVVRDSNPWAMRWVGRPRHLPKPQDLKAKTIPYDPSKSAKDNQFAGLASAQGLSDADRRALLAKGYTIRGESQLIVDPNGNRLYSDTDLHGIYNENGTDAWSDGVQQKMNDSFLERMIQHGPQDNWPVRNDATVAGPNAGPKPPVTAYLPDGTTQHMQTIEDMKQFYQAHGMNWQSLYPGY